MLDSNNVKKIIKDAYAEIAAPAGSCGCSCGCGQSEDQAISESVGYSKEELAVAPDANLGLGCGNPVALGKIKEGDTVLDLGSGAGLDSFLAAKKVGAKGKVIGVDMTPGMVEKATANALKYGYANVEFRLGDIEALPVEDASVDVIISNCVINLAPDKAKVFSEAARVLKPGGRIFVSDIVLLEELTEAERNDGDLIAGCVGGAILRDKYLELIYEAGLTADVLKEDKEIAKRQYVGFPLESILIEAVK